MPISTPPVAVCWVSALMARARPKSATLMRPSGASRTFSGFTSRWIILDWWAAASADSTGSRSSSALLGFIGASLRIRSRIVWPGMYSITRKSVPSSSPWSKTETTLGWDSLAAVRASRTNRWANWSSSPMP